MIHLADTLRALRDRQRRRAGSRGWEALLWLTQAALIVIALTLHYGGC